MNGKNISIVGGGISGVSLGKLLKDDFNAIIYERESTLGGLIRCKDVNGVLFHQVGGHVFNSKNQTVLDWFWKQFDKTTEFNSVVRDARIFIKDKYYSYPIENNLYKFDKKEVEKIVDELLVAASISNGKSLNFHDFLLASFGPTLCEMYFFPYNQKIWKHDLKKMPLPWLDGKLPMPNYQQILSSNILRLGETEMVHSTFFYPKRGGSQFIINRLSDGLNFRVFNSIDAIEVKHELKINSTIKSDAIVYCGDVRKLPKMLESSVVVPDQLRAIIENLPAHGTSNVLCEFDGSDLSWLYFPESKFKNHRIINTGSFSANNNGQNPRKTCVVEFTGKISQEDMIAELDKLPGNIKPLDFNYQANSYIIHEFSTRQAIRDLKDILEKKNIFLLGRFAEWEYYNMDKCIEAAMNLRAALRSKLN